MAAKNLASRMKQFEAEAKLRTGSAVSSEVDDSIDAENKRKNVQLNRKLRAFDQECKISINLIDREIQSVRRFQQQIKSQRKSTTPPEGERLRKISSSSNMKLPPITERRQSLVLDSVESESDADSARPTPRASVSWTPGVNETSVKRIRERVLLSLGQERKQSRSVSMGDRNRPNVDSLLPFAKSFENNMKPISDTKTRHLRASTGSTPFPANHSVKTSPPASTRRSSTDTATTSSGSASAAAPTANSKISPGRKPNERVRKRASTVLPVDHQFVQSKPLEKFTLKHSSSSPDTSNIHKNSSSGNINNGNNGNTTNDNNHNTDANKDSSSDISPSSSRAAATLTRRLRAATLDPSSLETKNSTKVRASILDDHVSASSTAGRSRAHTFDVALNSTATDADKIKRRSRHSGGGGGGIGVRLGSFTNSSASSSNGSLERGWNSQEKLVLFPSGGAKMPTGKPLNHHHQSLDRLVVEH